MCDKWADMDEKCPGHFCKPVYSAEGHLSGHFRGGMCGNAVPVIKRLSECMGMAFSLLKCLVH